MKRIIYITTLFLPLLAGCNKPDSSAVAEEFDRYIFFSQSVETKASLVESATAMGQFGVVGFKYDKATDWNAYKSSNPAPNVFYDDAGTSVVTVETLTCNADASASYTPLQGWSNVKKYAFFAYYPINDNVTLVSPDGTAYTGGTPAIKYELNTTDLKESMVDVMTAPAHTDKYWYSESDNNVNNSDIKFSFAHRLSCLGLKITNSSAGSILIDNVEFNVSGINYKEVIIPLDGSAVTKSVELSPLSAALSLSLTSDEQILLSGGGPVEIADKLIFIPQTESLSISIKICYTRTLIGYNAYEDTITLPASQPLTTSLAEGRKHLVSLKFTDSTVEVGVTAEEEGWTEIPDVDNSFN